MITDEMVEKATIRALNTYWIKGGNSSHLNSAMRAALEAVAPMLAKALTDADICRAKAQGMREAADIGHYLGRTGRAAILARAQELDPK